MTSSRGLEGIVKDVEAGTLKITEEYEDIHSFVEANLIDRIGDTGKKLHTGRSRNDQVALDMKLYVRDEIGQLDQLVKHLLETLNRIMEENLHTYMPGFSSAEAQGPHPRWPTIWALILRCSAETGSGWRISPAG